MKPYKTNPRLWFVLALLAFFAIGFLVHFDMKGDNVPLVQVIGSAILRGDIGAVVVFAGWALVAAALGWAVQCVIVVIAGWKRGRP